MAGPITCPSCGTKNRVPAAAAGIPRCASCHADLPWLVEAGEADFDQARHLSYKGISDPTR